MLGLYQKSWGRAFLWNYLRAPHTSAYPTCLCPDFSGRCFLPLALVYTLRPHILRALLPCPVFRAFILGLDRGEGVLAGAGGVRAFNGFFLLGDLAFSFTATGQEQGILWGQDGLHSSLPSCAPFPFSTVGYGSWFEHVQEFWEHRMDSNVLFLKYEDMHRVSSWGYAL